MIRESDIVLAGPTDARAIAQMSRQLIEQGLGWRWTPPRVLDSIRNPDRNVAVVKRQDRLIGFGIMEYGFDDAHLLLFAVRPEHRRRRIGSRILRWLEETAIVAGIERSFLETRLSNRDGRRFYRAHGYEETEVVSGYYEGRESAVRMMRSMRVE